MKVKNIEKLTLLYNQSPRLTYKEIADIYGVSVANITYAVTRLQKEGVLQPRTGQGTTLDPVSDRAQRLAEFVALKEQGLTWQQIGSRYNLTKQAVHIFVTKHFPDAFKREQVDLELLITLYNQVPRLSEANIAKQLGRSLSLVRRYIAELKSTGRLVSRPKTLTVAQHERLQKLCELRAEGMTWAEIATAFDTSLNTQISFVRHHAPHLIKKRGKAK